VPPLSAQDSVQVVQAVLQRETIPPLMGRLINFLIENPKQEFYRGKLIIGEAHRIRIRQ